MPAPPSPATVQPHSHLPDTDEVPRVERPGFHLDRKRDPRWRDRHAVDIAPPHIRQRVTQPPPLRRQRCRHPSNLILRTRTNTAAASETKPMTSADQQPDHDHQKHTRYLDCADASGYDGGRARGQACAPLAAARRRRRYCWRRGKLHRNMVRSSHPVRTIGRPHRRDDDERCETRDLPAAAAATLGPRRVPTSLLSQRESDSAGRSTASVCRQSCATGSTSTDNARLGRLREATRAHLVAATIILRGPARNRRAGPAGDGRPTR